MRPRQYERLDRPARVGAPSFRGEAFLGLLLGALSVCALLWLIAQAEASLAGLVERNFAPSPTRAEPGSRAKLPAITSTALAPSPRYDDDRASSPRAEPVASYTLRASLDPSRHIVDGEGVIVFSNRSRVPLTELYFHLYLNAFKSERTLFSRASPLSGRRLAEDFGQIDLLALEAEAPFSADLLPLADKHSPGDPDDETDLRVPLPEPLPPGASLRLRVRWRAKLPHIVARTGHRGSFHMVAQWFPKLARLEADGSFAHFPFHPLSEFSSDFGRYDVHIEVPRGYVVGATGPRVERHEADGKLRLRHVEESVHDFAWVAWDGFREREEIHDGVTIRALFPEGYEDVVARQIETAKFGLEQFGRAFGAYPYPVLTIVHPPSGAEAAGGMEYPTLITTGGPAFLPTSLRTVEHLTLHELGHQWFYGLVASDEHAWPFLDEGINSYVESVFLAERFGRGSFFDGFGLGIGIAEGHRLFSIERGPVAPVAQPAPDFGNFADYASLVYSRTATIFQTFARVYGEDELFRALGRYARHQRFEHPGLEEIVAALRPLGEGVEEQLRIALSNRGSIDYRVEDAFSEREAHGDWRGFALVRRDGSLAFPVQIELVSEDGERQRVEWDGREASLRIPYRGKSPLLSVTVDPDATVWLDEDLFNNSLRVKGKERALRVLDRIGYLGELFLHLVLP